MAWTNDEFARMREDRFRYLDEIARIERGEPPSVTMRIDGEIVEDRDERLVRHKQNVAEIEEILSQNGEGLDA